MNAYQEHQKAKAAAPDQENAAFGNANPQQDHKAKQVSSATSRILKSRSTETKTQRDRAHELLKLSPQTTYELRRKGISHPAQRLKELKNAGHKIVSHRVTAVDSDGYTHVGVALYSLEEPK